MSESLMPPVTPPAKPIPVAAIANEAIKGADAVLNASAGTEPNWAKPAVSILTLVVFIALIIVAYSSHDATSLAILSGVGASMAQQVAGYYLGSSSGSTAKTNLLAAAPAVNVVPTK